VQTNSSGFTASHSGFSGITGFIPLSIGIALFWSSTAFDKIYTAGKHPTTDEHPKIFGLARPSRVVGFSGKNQIGE
jgi:hypothetical protein